MKTIDTVAMANMHSYMEAQDPDVVRYCDECGEECKEGQALWNGWYCYKGLYHAECAPAEHRRSP